MEGTIEDEINKGIIPRIGTDVFTYAEDLLEEFFISVKISFLEIYLEKVKDLLDDSEQKSLKVYEGRDKFPYVKGIKEVTVLSVSHLMEQLTKGSNNRKSASTRANERSSRSHSIFQITVEQENKESKKKFFSKLFLVDLAGSERAMSSDAVTYKESKSINLSLCELSYVISKLAQKEKHIPYRNSVLTRLLKESLGGNSRTSIILNVSPTSESETKYTLDFGYRAKVVENIAVINDGKRNRWKILWEHAKFILGSATNEIFRWRAGESVPEGEWINLEDHDVSIPLNVSAYSHFTDLNQSSMLEGSPVDEDEEIFCDVEQYPLESVDQKSICINQNWPNNCVILLDDYRKKLHQFQSQFDSETEKILPGDFKLFLGELKEPLQKLRDMLKDAQCFEVEKENFKEVYELSEKVSSLQAAYSLLSEETKNLNKFLKDNSHLSDDYEELLYKYTSFCKEMVNLSRQSAHLDPAYLCEELRKITEEHFRQNEDSAGKSIIGALLEEKQSLENYLQQLIADHSKQEQEKITANNEVQRLASDLYLLEEQKQSLDADLMRLNKDQTTLKCDLDQLTADHHKVEKDLENIQADYLSLLQKNQSQEADLEKLVTEVSLLKKEKLSLEETLQKCNAKNSALQKEKALLENKFEESDQSFTNLLDYASEMQCDLTAKEVELQETSDKYLALKDEHSDLEDKYNNEVQKLKDQLKIAANVNEELTEKYTSVEKSHDSLLKEHLEFSKEKRCMLTNFQEYINKLNSPVTREIAALCKYITDIEIRMEKENK